MSDFQSNSLLRRQQRDGIWAKAETIVENQVLRFADFAMHPVNPTLVAAVQEDHTNDEPSKIVNTLVVVDTETKKITTLASGRSFYSHPRFNKKGNRILWFEWQLPAMPWSSSQLCTASFDLNNLELADIEVIAGGLGNGISVSQPNFVGDSICYLCDKNGYTQLYEHSEGSSKLLTEERPTRDIGELDWMFGNSQWTPLSNHLLLASTGSQQLTRYNLRDRSVKTYKSQYKSISNLHAVGDNEVVFLGTGPTQPSAIVSLNLSTGAESTVKTFTEDNIDSGYISDSRMISFDTTNPVTLQTFKAFANYYPPTNKDYCGPPGAAPPAILRIHGGPTASASLAYSLQIQFWTSRGFAFVDVDYGGSSSYGKAFRSRLDGNWGVVDLQDAVACSEYLVVNKLAHPDQVAITGGSAGGYTVLQALCHSKAFNLGISSYGIADLTLLATHTHKFESEYLYDLIGGTPEQIPQVYKDRSPLNHARNITAPLLVLQGVEDKVVPKEQADAIVEAVKRNGVKVEYCLFQGEGHGFRRQANKETALKKSLDFCCEAFSLHRTET